MQQAQRTVPVIDGFRVLERTYSDDPTGVSVGIANISAVVPGIEENKSKIERALRILAERGVNVAIFPEFALSGYFWADEPECWSYMEQAVIEEHLDWIDEVVLPMCGTDLRAVILNNLAAGHGKRFHNRTMILSPEVEDHTGVEHSYDKIFLPGIEKVFTEGGGDERLVAETGNGDRIGFTTCYDYLFSELLRRYSFDDGVDAIVQIASWRAVASREYPRMNVSTDMYYGELWDVMMSAASAQNQVWTLACNAVGRHGITGTAFWGGSGIWAPSGMLLLQASNVHEELLIVHNLDIRGGRRFELDDFNYEFDFRQVHRNVEDRPAIEENVD